MAINDLKSALVDELRDLLSAEKQLTKALPKMVKSAQDSELRKAFESHLKETEGHVDRLKTALESLEVSTRAKKCEAMEGLINEGEELMEEGDDSPVGDTMLIAAAQKVEHYEIASYGTALAWANVLGANDVVKQLKKTMDEEKSADEKLTKIASRLNEAALQPVGA